MCDVPIQKARSPRDEAQVTIPIIARTLNRQKRRHKLNKELKNLQKIVDQSSLKRSTRLLKISIDSANYRSIADNFSVDSIFQQIGRLDRSTRSVPGTTNPGSLVRCHSCNLVASNTRSITNEHMGTCNSLD